jgi:DNA polymerase III epsilon subunit-like protein
MDFYCSARRYAARWRQEMEAAPARLVVAHNAAFDRKFLERPCETFSTKPWACSISQINWAAEGYEGSRHRRGQRDIC